MAILNLWGFDSKKFESAFKKKDRYLNIRKKIEENQWADQPVVIVDMDDVIVDFRKGFSKWLKAEHDIDADVESKEYYFIENEKPIRYIYEIDNGDLGKKVGEFTESGTKKLYKK